MYRQRHRCSIFWRMLMKFDQRGRSDPTPRLASPRLTTITSSPITSTSGFLKCRNAVIAASAAQSNRFPSSAKKCSVNRSCQTCVARVNGVGTGHSYPTHLFARNDAQCFPIDSLCSPNALLEQSRDHHLVLAGSAHCVNQIRVARISGENPTHLNGSYTLDAIGLISELIRRNPSYGRSSRGFTIVALTCARTLARQRGCGGNVSGEQSATHSRRVA